MTLKDLLAKVDALIQEQDARSLDYARYAGLSSDPIVAARFEAIGDEKAASTWDLTAIRDDLAAIIGA